MSRYTAMTLAFLSCVSLGVAHANTMTHHTVLFQGKVAGRQTTTVRLDGRITIDYSYRNNGRGPDLKQVFKLDRNGWPVAYTASGKSTFGAVLAERYQREGDAVSWESASDKGRLTVQGPTLYVPVESSPGSDGLLVRALLKQGGQASAVPSGSVRAERLAQASLQDGNRRIEVALYTLNGLDTEPQFIWLTDDAEQRFFASVWAGGTHIIDADWVSQAEALLERQSAAEAQILATLASKLTHRLPQPLVLRNVRVFDSEKAQLGGLSDVYVNDGTISALYPAGSTAREAATVIEGNGRVLLPGLFDMHTHSSSWNLLLQAAGGVTTSRDMGNDNRSLADLRERLERGTLVGPRIVMAGFIEGESPFSARSGIVVKDVQGAKEAVDWYAQRGYRQIKLYNSFRPEWVAPTAEYAHSLGLRVSGHVPAFMRAEEAVRAGFDEIQHLNQVMLNMYSGPGVDTRTLLRFTLIGERVGSLNLDSEPVRQYFELLASRGTVIDATLTLYESLFMHRNGETDPAYAPIAAHAPVVPQRSWRTTAMQLDKKKETLYRASYARLLEVVGRLHRMGVPLVAGTDAIAGFTLHRELELYVQAGIPAGEALRIATWNGAKYTDTLAEAGSITIRKNADLTLVDGDPIADISNIRRVSLVLKGDSAYFPAEIHEAVGFKRFANPPQITVNAAQ